MGENPKKLPELADRWRSPSYAFTRHDQRTNACPA
jgi:hypothetical protein